MNRDMAMQNSSSNEINQTADLLRRPQSLSDAVYESVLQKLFSLEIRPEERIIVPDLARKLGVSQTPIREALTRLEGQGLVNKIHLIGYRAAPQLSKEEFVQLYDARILLEPHVAGKAATLIDEDALDRLEQLLDSLGKVNRHDSDLVVRIAQVDSDFHRTIAAASGNLVIARILDSLQVQVQFTLLRRRIDLIDVHPATIEHRQILTALRKHDAKSASNFMRQHLATSRNRYWPQNET
jgi:DNA-binding GntR family transcriptional regulator